MVYFFSDLINVFEVFLPQLLLYPNPTDPLNGEAATLLLRDKIKYEQSVRGNDKVEVNICNIVFIFRQHMEVNGYCSSNILSGQPSL